MPRSIWNGVISFGMVSIPVKLYNATEDKDIAFHQLHQACGSRLKQLRWCPVCDREARLLLDLLTPLHSPDCPFSKPPTVPRFLYWCRPELVCHVRYAEWAADGKLRFPVFVAPRPDIAAAECVFEG